MRTAAQRAADNAQPAAMAAKVASTGPVTVTVNALDGGAERKAVRGYPRHPAAREPVRGDGCLVTFDERDRLWITSWEA